MKNLKNVIALLTISLFSLNSIAQSNVAGEWITEKENTVIKIEQNYSVYVGKIISSDNPKAKMGKLIVKDLKKTDGTWIGKLYSPERKEWYDAEFIRKGNKLNIEISVGFFSKPVVWTQKK